jgi:hypothetical protein
LWVQWVRCVGTMGAMVGAMGALVGAVVGQWWVRWYDV